VYEYSGVRKLKIFLRNKCKSGTAFALGNAGLVIYAPYKRRKESMKNEHGFSLIELLIVVAIIAIIAAIAVPSMLQARMAANESGAIQGLRTVGSAEVAFSAVNNQTYAALAGLITASFVDSRFTNGFNGYNYTNTAVNGVAVGPGDTFAVQAVPKTAGSTGRYTYGINSDQIVRWISGTPTPKCGTSDCATNAPIGSTGSGS
jgi:type IV pilus assembly protein PilA